MRENKSNKHPLSLFALRTKRMTGFLIVAFLLFNYPLLSVANNPGLFFGIPVLYLYLFSIWLLVIIISAFMLNAGNNNGRSDQ